MKIEISYIVQKEWFEDTHTPRTTCSLLTISKSVLLLSGKHGVVGHMLREEGMRNGVMPLDIHTKQIPAQHPTNLQNTARWLQMACLTCILVFVSLYSSLAGCKEGSYLKILTMHRVK